MRKIVLASNNAGKVAEFQSLFDGLQIQIIPQGQLGVSEAEEPFDTFVENALAKAERAAQALADIPATIAGRAPCAKTGSFNFTRIYFPRAFVSTPDVVPGIQDFTGTWRVVAIVGLTPEYVDLTTNYWHVGNTCSYVAIGERQNAV